MLRAFENKITLFEFNRLNYLAGAVYAESARSLMRETNVKPGEVEKTYADTSALERDFGFKPKVLIEDGLAKFVDWYRQEWRSEGKR